MERAFFQAADWPLKDKEGEAEREVVGLREGTWNLTPRAWHIVTAGARGCGWVTGSRALNAKPETAGRQTNYSNLQVSPTSVHPASPHPMPFPGNEG